MSIDGILAQDKSYENPGEVYRNVEIKYNIAEIPHRAKLQFERLLRIVGNKLENLRDKKVLDLGCGSNSSQLETAQEEYERHYEPWLCRLLYEVGARPIGIDIGDLDNEEFEHYSKDLVDKAALDFIDDGSIDFVNALSFLGATPSPALLARDSINTEQIEENLIKQSLRVLKDTGLYLEDINKIYERNGDAFIIFNSFSEYMRSVRSRESPL